MSLQIHEWTANITLGRMLSWILCFASFDTSDRLQVTSSKCFHLAVPYWFVSGIFLPLSYGSDSAELGKPLIFFHIWNDEYDWSHLTLSAGRLKGKRNVNCQALETWPRYVSNAGWSFWIAVKVHQMMSLTFFKPVIKCNGKWSFGKIPNGLRPSSFSENYVAIFL